VRSGPGEASTILLFHIISARPSKQPRMVRTFLKVHTRPRLAYPLRCRFTESSTNKQHIIIISNARGDKSTAPTSLGKAVV
jgi:hypothetical protein